jgi:uncharacterized protein YycO
MGYAQHFPISLQEGDLLFYTSETGNAITDVTSGFEGKRIDHVSIFTLENDKPYILEATHKGVVMQPIDSTFERLNQRKEHIYIGRIQEEWNVKASISKAKSYIGRPYDFYFEPNDSAIYCSELVQLSYRDNKGQLIFAPIPMSFHDNSGEITNFWKEYYRKAGKEVPEGAPGSNPGDLSRNHKVKIIGQLR